MRFSSNTVTGRASPFGFRPSVLIVSNGYGEDAVGNAIASALRGKVDALAYPLVGFGHAYQSVPLLEPRKTLPSGGFGLRGSWGTFMADLRQGYVGLWRGQRRTLRGQRGKHARIVAIGDVYCLWMAAHAGRPIVFIATAKSEYNESHRWFERYLIRTLAATVYVRDQATADTLARHNLAARYVGNPLMDTIEGEGDLMRDTSLPTVTLLPGSRREAIRNLVLLLHLCTEVAGGVPANFLCALAPRVSMDDVIKEVRRAGWHVTNGILTSGMVQVPMTREFGPAVRAADIVVGLSGTGNEQAAGLGKPVVAFPGSGAQYTSRFMRLQHRLLGEAMVAAPNWKEAAAAVIRVLSSPGERARRGQVGRERMGEPGAIQRIAGELL